MVASGWRGQTSSSSSRPVISRRRHIHLPSNGTENEELAREIDRFMHKRPSLINNSRNGGGKLRKGEKFTTLKSNFGGPINRVGRESFVLFLSFRSRRHMEQLRRERKYWLPRNGHHRSTLIIPFFTSNDGEITRLFHTGRGVVISI